MHQFFQRFGHPVIGHLSGFDRMMFRGSMQRLCHPAGVLLYVYWLKVWLKDFGTYAQDTTTTLCTAIERQAVERDTPMIYLASTAASKEERALAEAAKHQRQSGLIAVLGCVEPCRTVVVRRGDNQRLQPRLEDRKCLHYYHYYLDAQFGLMSTRLQSWFPFTMSIGINGREWLAEQMKQANLDYVKVDNCFPYIEDFSKAQALLDAQVHEDWPRLLEQLTARDHPLHGKLLPGHNPSYWSLHVSEWATDMLFRTREDLAQRYPLFVRHALETMHGGDAMRFLGYKVPATGRVHGQFQGEVLIDRKRRQEGTRLQFQVKTNSAKMYDKHSNLRLESTINNPREFTCERAVPGEDEGATSSHRMRKGVVDMVPRAQVCQEINHRQANFLAAAADTESVGTLVEAIRARRLPDSGLSQPRRARGLARHPDGRERDPATPSRSRHTPVAFAASARLDLQRSPQPPLPYDRPRPTHHHRRPGRPPHRHRKANGERCLGFAQTSAKAAQKLPVVNTWNIRVPLSARRHDMLLSNREVFQFVGQDSNERFP